MKAKETAETFEQVYGRLEETVAKLEAGGLPLDETIALYEDGMRLAARCQEMLDAAELKVTRLRDLMAARPQQSGMVRDDEEDYGEG